MAYQPLKIRWKLKSPLVVSGDIIHLDGLLAFAWVERSVKREGVSFKEAVKQSSEALPLEKESIGGVNVWKASALRVDYRGRATMRSAIRKTDVEQMALDRSDNGVLQMKANSVNLGSGPLRNYDYRFAVRWVNQIEAWCVGDENEVRELLTDWVPGLGLRCRNGWGSVVSVAVEKLADEKDCNWRWRNLPVSDDESPADGDMVRRVGAANPPYWKKSNWIEVVGPAA